MWFFIASAVLAASYGIVSAYVLDNAKVSARQWSAAAAVLVYLVAIGVRVHVGAPVGPAGTAAAVPAPLDTRIADSRAWPGTQQRVSAVKGQPANGAAPVSSLIGGLEQRLADNPNDAKGWALLAQSYAFVGNTEGAERARQRAVELGFDDLALEQRVKLAERNPQPPGSNDAAIHGE